MLFPTTEQRNGKFCELSIEAQEDALKACTFVLRRVAGIIFQEDSDGFMNAIRFGGLHAQKIHDVMLEGIENAGKGSVEKRVLHACLCTALSTHDAHAMMDKIPKKGGLQRNAVDVDKGRCHSDGETSDGECDSDKDDGEKDGVSGKLSLIHI